MNTDLFDRKVFLSGNSMQMKQSDWFSSIYRDTIDYTIVKINTPRATFNEAGSFGDFIESKLRGKKLKVIIDFGNCEFIDSTFIGTIVKIFNKMKNADKNIILVVPNKKQASILLINKLDRLFKIFSSIENAISFVRA